MRWIWHVLRRVYDYLGRRVNGIEVQGMRKIGTPKRIWLDSTREYLREKGVLGEEVCGTIQVLRNAMGGMSHFQKKLYGSTLLALRGGGWVSHFREKT